MNLGFKAHIIYDEGTGNINNIYLLTNKLKQIAEYDYVCNEVLDSYPKLPKNQMIQFWIDYIFSDNDFILDEGLAKKRV